MPAWRRCAIVAENPGDPPGSAAVSETDKTKPATKPEGNIGYMVKLPIPDADVTCNLSLWKGSFTIKKMTYDNDKKQVVFVLEAVRDFTFEDDGFEAIKFYDEDGVDMIQKKNITYDADPRKLKAGESTSPGWQSPMRGF